MASIKVTPETLDAQGGELKSLAGELQDTLDKVNTKVGEIIDGWDGLAQDSYFDMYETMNKSLQEFPKLVDSLGDATQSAAKAFSEVDSTLQGSFKGQA